MPYVVKRAFEHKYGHGGVVRVPKGAKLEPWRYGGSGFWVDPKTYPPRSFDRHDATHYGIPVGADNAEEI